MATDIDQSTVRCKYCRHKASRENTSNLFQHLRRKHPIDYDGCVRQKSDVNAENIIIRYIIYSQTPIPKLYHDYREQMQAALAIGKCYSLIRILERYTTTE